MKNELTSLNDKKNKDDTEDMYIIIEGGNGNNYRKTTESDLKKSIQFKLSETAHLSVFLGSGSSLPAIPQMKTTFLDFKSKHNTKSFQRLMDLYMEDKTHDLENIEMFLSWLGSRIEGLSSSEISGEKSIRNEIESALIDSISKGFSKDYQFYQTYNDANNYQHIGDSGDTELNYETFMSRIARLRDGSKVSSDAINIFTTNYDLFIENSLDRLNYSYTDGFRHKLRPEFNITEYSRRPVDVARRFRDRWSTVSPFFKIYKLHGSLNWQRDGQKIIRKSDWTGHDSVVIAPTSSKYADSQGAPFSDLFRELSVELLKPNTTLIINGFGFGDGHINELLVQALGRDDFSMIAFVNDKEQNVKVFMDIVRGNPKATFITNGSGNEKAYYFSTLVKLLAFEDPFEKSEPEDENEE